MVIDWECDLRKIIRNTVAKMKRRYAHAALAAALAAGTPLSAFAQTSRAHDPAVDARAAIASSQAVAPGGIDELKAIELGGIKQWINVRGNDPANPILLFLHGGPGSPMMPESWTFQRPWEDFFTVVQWDQRGAGKTFSSAGRRPDTSMTIARMQADTEELIEYLRHTYGKRKIFLMGHSWGSILGLRVAQHRPDLLYAYIGVGQVVNGQRNEVVGYQQTLARAEAIGNDSAVQELKAIAPYPDPGGNTPLSKTRIERRWDVALGGMVYGRSRDNASETAALSPAYTDYDEQSARLGAGSSVQILWPQMETVDFDSYTTFKCPVFFFAGVDDRTTPESIVEKYYSTIKAPKKKFFRIDRAAHYVVNEAPGVVLMHLVLDIRPLYRSDDGG